MFAVGGVGGFWGSRCRWNQISAWTFKTAQLQALFRILQCGRQQAPSLLVSRTGCLSLSFKWPQELFLKFPICSTWSGLLSLRKIRPIVRLFCGLTEDQDAAPWMVCSQSTARIWWGFTVPHYRTTPFKRQKVFVFCFKKKCSFFPFFVYIQIQDDGATLEYNPYSWNKVWILYFSIKSPHYRVTNCWWGSCRSSFHFKQHFQQLDCDTSLRQSHDHVVSDPANWFCRTKQGAFKQTHWTTWKETRRCSAVVSFCVVQWFLNIL